MFELAQPVRFCVSSHSWLAGHAGLVARIVLESGPPVLSRQRASHRILLFWA
jgi:hypothetical protein